MSRKKPTAPPPSLSPKATVKSKAVLEAELRIDLSVAIDEFTTELATVPVGEYTEHSHRLAADLAEKILERCITGER